MRRYLSVVLALCLSVAAVAAGSSTAQDPITGTWAGELAPGENRVIAVTMELAFDGKGRVTGTATGLPNPADVKSGTFDLKTGALVLRLGRADGPAVLLVLEGTVVKGVATGKLSGEAGGGTFRLAKK